MLRITRNAETRRWNGFSSDGSIVGYVQEKGDAVPFKYEVVIGPNRTTWSNRSDALLALSFATDPKEARSAAVA